MAIIRRLICVLLFMLFGISCLASADSLTEGDYTYTIDKGKATINGYHGSDTAIIVPAKINGYSVEAISNGAFRDLTTLESIVLEEGISKIGMDAFSECRSLQEIVLPDSIISIGDDAFFHCNKLKEIRIPKNTTEIGLWAFISCEELESISVDQNNQSFISLDGVLFTKDMRTLVRYPQGKEDTSYCIPEGVAIIGDGAFMDCANLRSIHIAETVTQIDAWAFYCCPNVEQFIVPNGVKTIGSRAFDQSGMSSIVFPESVEEWGSCILWSGINLRQIEFLDESPSESMSRCIIEDELVMPNLETIYVPYGTREAYEGILEGYFHSYIQEREKTENDIIIYDKNGQILTPSDANEYSLHEGEYKASGNTKTYNIHIPDGERVLLILDSVTIDLAKALRENCRSAISVGTNAELILILRNGSENILRGSEGYLELPDDYIAGGYAAISNSKGSLVVRCESCLNDEHQCDNSCGSLLAVGGYSAAGIGGNSRCDGKNITILGGRITAKGQATPQKKLGNVQTFEFSGAGIGGGYDGEGSNITICGGVIHAEGEMDGPGIGGSFRGIGKDIKINDGIVTAIGGAFAAGIGGGTHAEGKDIVISGGIINATGGAQGSGIGGGHSALGKDISILGGEIKAISLHEGAGIGGGTCAGAENIEISGGNIVAIGGMTDDLGKDIGIDGEGIGRGGYLGKVPANRNVETDNITINPNRHRISAFVGYSENQLSEIDGSPFTDERNITKLLSDKTYVMIKSEFLPLSGVELPQTGDNSQIILWLALLALAGSAVLVIKRKTA